MAESRNISTYYEHVQNAGFLRSPMHARRWTRGVLQQLGVNLSRGTKRSLAKALPEELADDLGSVFWLIDFRNTNITMAEFQELVARRSGNSDIQFARHPVKAVFGGVKALVDQDVSRQVADDLSPELREIWQQAVSY